MRGVAVARRRRAVALAVVCAGCSGRGWRHRPERRCIAWVGAGVSGGRDRRNEACQVRSPRPMWLRAGRTRSSCQPGRRPRRNHEPLHIQRLRAAGDRRAGRRRGQGPRRSRLTPGRRRRRSSIESSGGSIGSITLRSLGVEMPTPGNPTQSGIVLVQPATIANVDVTSTGTTLASAGIAVTEGGTLSHVDVTAPDGNRCGKRRHRGRRRRGYHSYGAGLDAHWFLGTPNAGARPHDRPSIFAHGGAGGYAINAASPILIDDSVLTAQGVATQGTALLVQSGFAAVGTQLTIVGNANTVGAEALGAGATVNLTDSIIANTVTFPLDSSSPGQVTTDYSDYVHPASYTPGAHDTRRTSTRTSPTRRAAISARCDVSVDRFR